MKFHFSMFFLATNRPVRFKKLREACRKNFHLVAPPKTYVVTSYDKKTQKVIFLCSKDKNIVFPIFRLWVKELALLELKFGFCMQRSSYGTPPELI